MSNTYIILALITSGVMTFAIRLFPFLVLRNQTKLSNRMQFISAALPQAIITILVVYCLKDISFINAHLGFQNSLPSRLSSCCNGGRRIHCSVSLSQRSFIWCYYK